jgi:tetratricopeptide (TPR) repeat protein
MKTCFHSNLQAAMAALVLFATACCLRLSAEDTSTRIPTMDEMWANSQQMISERGWPGSDGTQYQAFPFSESYARDPELTQTGSTVSVEELRHPLSGKGRTMIEKAQRYSRSGDYSKAIQELNQALKEPSAEPYAHMILGYVYLKLRRTPEAVQELGQATSLLPRFPAGHSNFGYALCVSGKIERGLEEVDTALVLDPNLLKARFLKGVILLDRDSREHDGWENLQLAQREIPGAHLALALYYARHGQDVVAQQQLQDFARKDLNVTLAQAQEWLTLFMPAGVSAGEALGLWVDSGRAGGIALDCRYRRQKHPFESLQGLRRSRLQE